MSLRDMPLKKKKEIERNKWEKAVESHNLHSDGTQHREKDFNFAMVMISLSAAAADISFTCLLVFPENR